MDFKLLQVVKEFLNYKLIYNFTITQLLSLFLFLLVILDIYRNRRLSYVIYILLYLNFNRFFINMNIINSDLRLLWFNTYLVVALYLLYFFRKEFLLLRANRESFSDKITDITYGKLVVKFKILNFFFFFRNCLLFIIDNIINFENIKREKKKLLYLIVFTIMFINIFGSYDFLLFACILVFVIEAEKKKYKKNFVYRNNFNENVRFFNILVSENKLIKKSIKYQFVQKANTLGEAGKIAADNPKTISVILGLAGVGTGLDMYLTYDLNNKIHSVNVTARQSYFEQFQKTNDSNIHAQKCYNEALLNYAKNPRGSAPIPPTYISIGPEPYMLPYKQTRVGAGITSMTNYIMGKKIIKT